MQGLFHNQIPGRIFLSYFVDVILIPTGVCLLVKKKARTAATFVRAYDSADGVPAPNDVDALNFSFYTLLF